MIEFQALLESLHQHEVAFVIVGGVASAFHGVESVNSTLDLVYERTPENLNRVETALSPFSPRLRGTQARLPCTLDAQILEESRHLRLSTSDGSIDLLGEISGVGAYREARQHSIAASIFDCPVHFLDLDALIVTKRAAGRPKDLEVLAELEAIREERERS